MDARLVLYAHDRAEAETAGAAAFDRIGELDTMMSDYRADSELMRLCDRAGGPPVAVSPELFLVMERAQEMAKRSAGAFDVTAGPIIRLWRAARKSGVLPEPAQIEAARKLTGWQKVQLDPEQRTVRLLTPGMKLDFGGIAKGYANDEAQRVLKAHGITRALIEMGGDILVSDAPPGRSGWTIRVPNAADESGPVDLTFRNRSISSSGDTVQFANIGGKRYSHVVDPRTGWALANHVQVTVTAPDGLTSDPLSTALTIVSPSERKALLRSYRGTTGFVKVFSAPK